MATFDVKLLENFIDYASLRNKVISKNIANIGTEGYQREDVDFKEMFAENLAALKTTDSRHIPASQVNSELDVTTDKSTDMVSGVNNVNIDEEMAELAKNSIQFKFASQKVGNYFKLIQSVINGGGQG
jgi:flagellar basal-body rod protein FlgB